MKEKAINTVGLGVIGIIVFILSPRAGEWLLKATKIEWVNALLVWIYVGAVYVAVWAIVIFMIWQTDFPKEEAKTKFQNKEKASGNRTVDNF